TLCLMLVACVGTRTTLPENVLAHAQVTSFENSLIRLWGDANSGEIDTDKLRTTPQLKVVKDPETGKLRQDFLVLSGGGSKGAYGAGLLNGWTAAGTRPEFSIVTGVSTGSIIAPFAYLGSSYDSLLTEFYTTYKTKDLLRPKLVGVLGGSSATDSKPLENLIAKYVTPNVLKAIAREYETGRYLLVGTTNLDAQRPVVWNMGEIAKKGDKEALELFRRVILASISIPGAFPPVLINVSAAGASGQELHVDGGTTDNAILVPIHIGLDKADTGRSVKIAQRVFVLINSNLSPKPKVIKASTLRIAARSIETLIQQQTSGDVLRIYSYAQSNRIGFNYTEIPDSFTKKSEELFDPVYMKSLYDLGFRQGENGGDWKKTPRGY
ncbi:MAG: patatin-like phospholipase family protein, partial [Rhizobiaceae bacterium]